MQAIMAARGTGTVEPGARVTHVAVVLAGGQWLEVVS